MMKYTLDGLAVEVLEDILSYLSLNDRRSIRLVCHTLERKATQRCFRNLFRRKKLDICHKGLQDFIEITRPGRLGCLIEDLTLCGMVIDYNELYSTVKKGTKSCSQFSGLISMSCEMPVSVEELAMARRDLAHLSQLQTSNIRLHQSREAVTLLTQAFENIRCNSGLRGLKSIALEVVCFRDDPIKRLSPEQYADIPEIWSAASDTFQTTMSALAKSNLPVETLQCYQNPSMMMCSLSRDRLSCLGDQLQSTVKNITSLSLSISAYPRSKETKFSDHCNEWAPDDDFTGLHDFLMACSSLRVLKVHYYELLLKRHLIVYDANHPDLTMFNTDCGWDSASLLKLDELSLSGVTMRMSDLLSFLEKNTIKNLELDNVRILQGSFRPIFDVCCSSPKLERVQFDDLYEHKMVYFLGSAIGRTSLRLNPEDPYPGTHSMIRRGNELRLPIEYHVPNLTPIRCPRNWVYQREIDRRFGPPWS